MLYIFYYNPESDYADITVLTDPFFFFLFKPPTEKRKPSVRITNSTTLYFL